MDEATALRLLERDREDRLERFAIEDEEEAALREAESYLAAEAERDKLREKLRQQLN